MSNQVWQSDLLVELSTEDQQNLAGGRWGHFGGFGGFRGRSWFRTGRFWGGRSWFRPGGFRGRWGGYWR
ncbi:hypothetical protein ACN23B_06015 [Anabaena sp. FACHB-709]|uniref:Uncharacterized protein n=2 Tax=Nostocaceae TaxID=1162 RepID=A0A1Z4KT92_ANAVA|nr:MULTISPECIES: hypothetical protein [Nostocaceae]BAY72178.1 hypothetical protein NIES23_50020 [Trichormus variabilis NIES-23]HBW28897.1 hypothetical protein [Nostoc sp. UBA8866]MBD2171388.1 hypothetical protein [Anabaena cylindrica FACHB-318]MBD2263170.1 hypothetical protein [Anabaena sp. FACHB-709]MBD2272716.1 hypothetical protein [Nostoc sp. PCC 7120 = FACHB-418]